MRGGGVVAEPSKKISVESPINHFFVRRLKQAIKIRRIRIFRRLGIPGILILELVKVKEPLIDSQITWTNHIIQGHA